MAAIVENPNKKELKNKEMEVIGREYEVEVGPGIDANGATISVEEPTVEEPAVEELTVEEPAVEEPAVEEQAVQEQAAQEPTAQEQAVQEQAAQEPTAQEPTAQEQASQEQAAQEQAAQESTAQEQAVEEPSAENVGDDAHDIPTEEPSDGEQYEVAEMISINPIEPQPNGVVKSIGSTPTRGDLEMPDTVREPLNKAYENVFTIDYLLSKAKGMESQYLSEDKTTLKFDSPKALKNFLHELNISYDEGKNIILEDNHGDKTAYFTAGGNNSGGDKSEQEEEQGISEHDMEEDRKDDSRIRPLGSMDPGQINNIVDAKSKKDFDMASDTVAELNTGRDVNAHELPKDNRTIRSLNEQELGDNGLMR